MVIRYSIGISVRAKYKKYWYSNQKCVSHSPQTYKQMASYRTYPENQNRVTKPDKGKQQKQPSYIF